MTASSSAPASPLPSYWDYGKTRPPCAARETNPASHAEASQPARWRGPGGFTLEFYETDLLNGATSRLFLRSPEGEGRWVEDVSLEIVEPERLVFTGRLGIENECFAQMTDTVTFRRA